jgi:hypothetical protein
MQCGDGRIHYSICAGGRSQGSVFRDRRPACKRIAPGATRPPFTSDGNYLGRPALRTGPIRAATAASCIRQPDVHEAGVLLRVVRVRDLVQNEALTTRGALINAESKGVIYETLLVPRPEPVRASRLQGGGTRRAAAGSALDDDCATFFADGQRWGSTSVVSPMLPLHRPHGPFFPRHLGDLQGG